jgi:hypothetical protein
MPYCMEFFPWQNGGHFKIKCSSHFFWEFHFLKCSISFNDFLPLKLDGYLSSIIGNFLLKKSTQCSTVCKDLVGGLWASTQLQLMWASYSDQACSLGLYLHFAHLLEDVAFLGRVKAKEHDIPEISTCLEAKLGGSLFQEHALHGHCPVYRTIFLILFFPWYPLVQFCHFLPNCFSLWLTYAKPPLQ